jgi:hypothetical protein
MAEYLEEHGFRTENIGYASTEQPIRELTEILHDELVSCPGSSQAKPCD